MYMHADLHCTSCRHFVLSPGESNTKWGKCKRFVIDHKEDTHGIPPSPAYLVSGVHDNSVYYDAIVCRALSHLCGSHGYRHEPLDGFGTT
jgi:hypothetical protein